MRDFASLAQLGTQHCQAPPLPAWQSLAENRAKPQGSWLFGRLGGELGTLGTKIRAKLEKSPGFLRLGSLARLAPPKGGVCRLGKGRRQHPWGPALVPSVACMASRYGNHAVASSV
jgi:hypothetical protein